MADIYLRHSSLQLGIVELKLLLGLQPEALVDDVFFRQCKNFLVVLLVQ